MSLLKRRRLQDHFFSFRPKLGERPEFGSPADEDRNLSFQGVRIIGGRAHVLDVVKEFFQRFLAIAEHDQAVSRIAARSPQKICLVSAEGGRQTVARSEKVDGAGLAIVLGEDAAIAALLYRDAVPGLRGFGDDLLPAELVGSTTAAGSPRRGCAPCAGFSSADSSYRR